jgi:glycosyltransferase involved in cell wall biosynthesis
MNPKISVIVLFYNHVDYVKQTLDALVDQDYDNYEILINDDCSKDNTAEEIKKYIDNCPKKDLFTFVNFQVKNQGLIKSFNFLLSQIKGDIVIGNAGDDISLSNRLSRAVELMEQYDVDLVASDAFAIDNDGNIFRQSCLHDSPFKMFNDGLFVPGDNVIINKNLSLHRVSSLSYGGYSLCFRKSLLDRTGGQIPSHLFNEDYFICFLANIGKGSVFSTVPLLKRRFGKSNMSIGEFDSRESILKTQLFRASYQYDVNVEKLKYIEKFSEYYTHLDLVGLKNILRGITYVLALNKNIFSSGKYIENFKILLKYLKNPSNSLKDKVRLTFAALLPPLYKSYLIKRSISLQEQILENR